MRRIVSVLLAGTIVAAAAPACVGDSGGTIATDTDGGAMDAMTSDGAVPGDSGAAGDACAKTCFDMCADVKDPRTGCAAASCAACPADPHQTASCTMAGACAAACDADYTDCNKTAPGCETHTSIDPMNCGGCAVVCGSASTTAASTCVDGNCVYACAAGTAHCSKDPSTGCETTINANDVNNCGACGHSCQGGTCVAGVCQSITLAQGMGYPTGLGLDGAGNLYVTGYSDGTIYKVSTTAPCGGGGQAACAKFATTNVANSTAVATDGTYVFWNNSQAHTIYRAKAADGSAITQVGSTSDLAATLGVASGSVWYTSRATPYLVKNGVAAADPSTQSPIMTGNGGDVETIAFDTTSVYAADQNLGQIFRLPLANPVCVEGTNCPVLVNAAPTVRSMATDANNVYWSESDGTHSTKVRRIAKTAGATPVDIATGQPSDATSVATDGVNVYWTTFLYSNGAGNVRTASVTAAAACDGATCKTLASGNNLTGLTVDSVAMYWASQSGGTVTKLAK
jgi:sugar lactone lactonase YvrE